MKTSDFFYNLPEELIAQTPVEPRDRSRLLVYNRGAGLTHNYFYDIEDYLNPGDVLVINNTRVIPARLFGVKPTGAKAEVLLLKRYNYTDWEVILFPGNKFHAGAEIIFDSTLKCKVLEQLDSGNRIVRFEFKGVFEDIINKIGHMPLPPYIKATLSDKERYQTVYNKIDGSAAAPTAGLHFTPELIKKLRDKGIIFAEILLHVGLSTFRPVKSENVEEHKMHFEYYEMPAETADVLNKAKADGRKIIAVGTTSVRVLETIAGGGGLFKEGNGETDIFIYPPRKVTTVDGLITNFHLPESTLIMLVASFIGIETTMNIYNTAVREKYRFFSFGDSMLLLR